MNFKMLFLFKCLLCNFSRKKCTNTVMLKPVVMKMTGILKAGLKDSNRRNILRGTLHYPDSKALVHIEFNVKLVSGISPAHM